MRPRPLLFASLATVMALALAGCASPTPGPSDGGPSSLSVESTPTPGISRMTGERVQAVGTLIYDRKDKRFELVDAGPDKRLTGKERVIAAIEEGSSSDIDLIGLIGGYVELSGPSVESTLAAFPELTIESIRIVALPSERSGTSK